MLWRTNNISHLSHLNTLFSQRRRTAASPLASWNSWFLCLFIYNPSWSPADLWTNKFISFFPLNTLFFSLRMRTAASPPAAWNGWFLCLRTAVTPPADWNSWFSVWDQLPVQQLGTTDFTVWEQLLVRQLGTIDFTVLEQLPVRQLGTADFSVSFITIPRGHPPPQGSGCILLMSRKATEVSAFWWPCDRRNDLDFKRTVSENCYAKPTYSVQFDIQKLNKEIKVWWIKKCFFY